jgi:hypothetical protein
MGFVGGESGDQNTRFAEVVSLIRGTRAFQTFWPAVAVKLRVMPAPEQHADLTEGSRCNVRLLALEHGTVIRDQIAHAIEKRSSSRQALAAKWPGGDVALMLCKH